MLAHERYNVSAKILLDENTIRVSEAMAACNVPHETAWYSYGN